MKNTQIDFSNLNLVELKRELRKSKARQRYYYQRHDWELTLSDDAYWKHLNKLEARYGWRGNYGAHANAEGYIQQDIIHRIKKKLDKMAYQSLPYFTVKVVRDDGNTILLCEHTKNRHYEDILAVLMKQRGKSLRGFVDIVSCTVFVLREDYDMSLAGKLEVELRQTQEQIEEELLDFLVNTPLRS